MRVARILGEGEAFYHILSRIVDRRLILDDAEKERFRSLMRAAQWKGLFTARRLQLAPVVPPSVC